MTVQTDLPEVGDLVQARGQQWVVSASRQSQQPIDELAASSVPGSTLVTLTSVSDDDLGDELTVVWEIEPGRQVLPSSHLPTVAEDEWDDPQRLGAFLDAVRWGTVASADVTTLQAPFRAGIRIEDYQLEPVAKALEMPRVNLLIADDVGLGKTIEAGLIVQELLLRHRSRRIIVVCPASLTGKWEGEMADRFGLAFEVLDRARLRELRRSHGLQANPFAVFPRVIISLQWLRTPRIQRLLDEVLTDADSVAQPSFFDLLVVDEAHHCAPPAPTRGKGYAVDSKQTLAVRRLGEHSGHRLFLSATPHNGYAESWQALLEMLDPERFARGVEPDQDVVSQIMVRRLKDTIVNADGLPRFPGRATRAIEVQYSADELRAHDLLEAYAAARRRQPGATAARLNDLVTLLLKKRLFSSPVAFARTLDAHVTRLRQGNPQRSADASGETDIPDWLADALLWDDEADPDGSEDELEDDLLTRATGALPGTDLQASELLDELTRWADRRGDAEDAKAEALVTLINEVCRPGGAWSDERLIVFTEYLDTLLWLSNVLAARGLAGDRIGLLHGGMDDARREQLKTAFQASPGRHPLRVLLATDAASEGIDLQLHCHRLVNYDIPFNPNRLEQRIGRVDRFGQRRPVEVVHFVGAGWQSAAPGSYQGDLEFLSRVATKVATERRDLGSVNPVLAAAVEARMLGQPVMADPTTLQPTGSSLSAAGALRAEQELRAAAEKIRRQLDDSIRSLHVAPANVRRVVDTALDLSGQPPLVDLGEGLVAPPKLQGTWEQTVSNLADPLDGTLRRLTFDPAVAEAHEDVVLAHLEHPLVAHSTRLLRSAIWGGRLALQRVSGVTTDLSGIAGSDAGAAGLLVAAVARLVVVGSDGARIHEEIILGGRWLPPAGRSRRVELDATKYAALRRQVEGALDPDGCQEEPRGALRRLAAVWADIQPLLADDVQRRAEQQLAGLERDVGRRRQAEIDRTNAVFDQLERTLRRALAAPRAEQLSFGDLTIPERHQVERDRRAWQARLEGIGERRSTELDLLGRRFADIRPLVFPFAILCCAHRP